jgi:hypothetical protein
MPAWVRDRPGSGGSGFAAARPQGICDWWYHRLLVVA